MREKLGFSLGKERPRVLENGVLKRIFEHRREALTGGWAKFIYCGTL